MQDRRLREVRFSYRFGLADRYEFETTFHAERAVAVIPQLHHGFLAYLNIDDLGGPGDRPYVNEDSDRKRCKEADADAFRIDLKRVRDLIDRKGAPVSPGLRSFRN